MADIDIKDIKGIGEKTALNYKRLGIENVGQLLRHYPVGYIRYTDPIDVAGAPRGEIVTLRCRLAGPLLSRQGRRVTVFTSVITDATGTLDVIFFNAAYLQNFLRPGIFYVFRGIINARGTMEHPEVFTDREYEKLTSSLRPRYSLTRGLSHNSVTKAIETAFSMGAANGYTRDTIPAHILEERGLMSRADALYGIHFPTDEDEVLECRKRLVFDEFFEFIYRMRSKRAGEADEPEKKSPFNIGKADIEACYELERALPFELTGAQKSAFKEIAEDLTDGVIMNRLIQGDVGSGKTIVAILSILAVAHAGLQGALMVPTEVLAAQHYENIRSLSKQYGLSLRPILLTGSMKAKEKKAAKALIASGEANLIVGTHALIMEGVDYRELALVVTDEQHRFGVRQRDALAQKGREVHRLVMSATPIPRTLALILYGDLSITVMNELPASRLPIKNALLGKPERPKALRHILNQINEGRQAYVICPMVEEGEMEGLENVVEYTKKLREAMPDNVRVEYLHGKMKPADKNSVMEAFGRGEIQILVSTTVIEVGIDVPNATVMMIENPERFGLSQLHQLRGRVGRGKWQSYCMFIAGTAKDLDSERLKVMVRTNDGFEIAREDLRLRGPGDLLGVRQSGDMAFDIADIVRDQEELKSASEAVDYCISNGIEVEITNKSLMDPVL